jgi:hypothetical protein
LSSGGEAGTDDVIRRVDDVGAAAAAVRQCDANDDETLGRHRTLFIVIDSEQKEPTAECGRDADAALPAQEANVAIILRDMMDSVFYFSGPYTIVGL